nr:phospholipase-like protein [Tanacetum cinerariifolium]
MRCEHQKLIVEENRIRLDEAKRLRQSRQIKCKFPWNDDYIIDRNFWFKLVCLDPARKGWLTKEHIDLWVEYMWHVRPENSNWAMVSCYFIQLLLQNGMPLFYVNRERYTTSWSEVDQFHIMSGEVTFYDTGHTYDYNYHDWIDDSTKNYPLFKVNYDGMFDERPLRYAYGKVIPLKLSNTNRMTYSELLDMLVYKLECKIRALFYSIPRNSLEIGLTIVECDNDVKKIYDTAELDIQSKVTSHEKLKSHGKLTLMTFDESRSWQKEQSISPLLRTPPLKKEEKSYEDVYGGGCFDVSGSFKGFDCIEELMGCDDGSLPVKIKDEFENEVILDDVVSSPATLSMLLKRKFHCTMTQTTSMKIDSNVNVTFTDTKKKVTGIKDVEDLQVRIEKLEEIFSYLRNRKLKQKEVILGTDDETSSNDDASSNDEISSSEDLINYLSARDVEWQLPKNTQEEPPKPHYEPIKIEVEEPLPLDIVAKLMLLVNAAEELQLLEQNEFPAGDEMFLEIDEVVFKIHTKGYFKYDPLRKKSLVTGGCKGKEKVIEDEGICSKGNKADVTIYKRAMVNGKDKMIEDVGAVKRGKERGVVIEDGGFSNDGGKETVVTKRAIGSRKMEGKSVNVCRLTWWSLNDELLVYPLTLFG